MEAEVVYQTLKTLGIVIAVGPLLFFVPYLILKNREEPFTTLNTLKACGIFVLFACGVLIVALLGLVLAPLVVVGILIWSGYSLFTKGEIDDLQRLLLLLSPILIGNFLMVGSEFTKPPAKPSPICPECHQVIVEKNK